jgi:hypothetical protein
VIELHRTSFPSLTAALYAGGALAHLVRVLVGLPLAQMPFLIDWIVTLLALYGGLGFALYFRDLAPARRWRRVCVVLMLAHLLATVVLHLYILAAASHAVLGIFPVGYSAAALAYFTFFAWLAATTHVPARARTS